MFKKIEMKTLAVGILMGGMVSFGTYFLLPPPQVALAATMDFGAAERSMRSAIRFCMDQATISGNFDDYGRFSGNISTYC